MKKTKRYDIEIMRQLPVEKSIYEAYKQKKIPFSIFRQVRLGIDYYSETGSYYQSDLVTVKGHKKNPSIPVIECILEFGNIKWYYYDAMLYIDPPVHL